MTREPITMRGSAKLVVRTTEHPPGTAVDENGYAIYGPPTRGRSCGSCKLCCVLVPAELDDGHKAANTPCKHLCSKGCGIYPRRPQPCVYWSCRWLFDPDTAGLRRPDRAGYVIDSSLDTILRDGEPLDVMQVWCDPNRRNAHRDPALRAYLTHMAEKFGLVAIVRYSSSEGFILVPPGYTDTGEWVEYPGNISSHEDMKAKLAAAGATRILDDGAWDGSRYKQQV
jgi:hypothetical protein